MSTHENHKHHEEPAPQDDEPPLGEVADTLETDEDADEEDADEEDAGEEDAGEDLAEGAETTEEAGEGEAAPEGSAPAGDAPAPTEGGETATKARRARSMPFHPKATLHLVSNEDDVGRREGSFGQRSLQIIKDNPGIFYEDYIAKGGRATDLRWDVEKGRVKIEDASEEDQASVAKAKEEEAKAKEEAAKAKKEAEKAKPKEAAPKKAEGEKKPRGRPAKAKPEATAAAAA